MRQSLFRRALAVVSALSAWTFGSASAQTYESPPVDVPTAPVPQGGTAPPPPAAKPPPPKPAPAPAQPPPAAPAAPATGAPAAGAPAAGGSAAPAAEPPPPPKANNEGVFKISGTKGAGIVGGTAPKKAPAGPAPKATTPKASVKGPAAKAAPAAKKSAAVVAQWPGFRMTEDGGSEVMVEFSDVAAAPTEHRAKGSVTYVFKGAHVPKHNNQNPLITVHFNTPVASARLVPKKGELHLIVDLRAEAPPMSGVRAGADGGGQFFVRFAPGTFLPKDADLEVPAPTQKLKGEGTKPAQPAGTPPSTAPATPPTGGSKTGPAP